eukprot:TCONS_00050925-protein
MAEAANQSQLSYEEGKKGYDFVTVDPSKGEENMCLICRLLIRVCAELPCGHAFCKSCLERWESGGVEKRNGQIVVVKAPEKKLQEDEEKVDQEERESTQMMNERPTVCIVCNEPFEKQDVHYSRRNDRMISNLEVYCQNRIEGGEGCEWTGPINEFEDHENNKCKFKRMECILGCGESILKKDEENHGKICFHRKEDCQYCNVKFHFFELNENQHYESCELLPISCGNQGCGKMLPRKEMREIHEKNCPFMKIKCDFVGFGCQEEMLKSEQDDHDKEFDSKHTKMMLRSLTRELSEMKKEIREDKVTKQELEDVKNELAITQGRFANAEKVNVEQKNIIDKTIGFLQFVEEGVTNLSPTAIKEMFRQLEEAQQKVDPKLLEPFVYEDKAYDFENLFCRFLKVDYEERIKILLPKMVIGEIYQIENGRQVIFKLKLTEN